MRVAFVLSRFPSPSETFFVHRFLRLLQRGWDMHVVCDASDASDRAFFPEIAGDPAVLERIHVRRSTRSPLLPLLVVMAFARCLWRAPIRTLRYVRVGWAIVGPRILRHLYRDEELLVLAPDVVHFGFGTKARGSEHLRRTLGSALVVSFQGADANYAGLGADPAFYGNVWREASGLHFLSEGLRQRAIRRGFVPDGRDVVIRPGVDATVFDPVSRPTSERVHILSVGRLHWKKGYDYALAAVADLRDRGVPVTYRIIGAGPDQEAVRFAISDLALEGSVEMLGAVPATEVRDHMQWAHILLHAATSEGFCYVVTEAQSMQLPVVTSDADGLPENVADGETGLIVRRRDPAAMADALYKLATDADLRGRMGAAGRRRVLDVFAPELETSAFETLYRDAYERARAG